MAMGTGETMNTIMQTNMMTLEQIRRAGMYVLFQNLGAVGMVRFLQQSEIGWGDYTQERHQWLNQDEDVHTLAERIIAQRSS